VAGPPRAPAPALPDAARPPATGCAIETNGLAKHFGTVLAVDGIDLRVPAGSVFGFLGPNGSGKTTTIRVLLGLLNPTGGSWRLLAQPMPQSAAHVLPKVGALIEGPAFYPWLTGAQNLARFDAAGPDGDRATRAARIKESLARVEPTNGMDPQGTREIRHLIQELARDGTTVFLSSHLLSEVEQVCTDVAVMSLGKILAQSTIAELQASGVRRLAVETVQVQIAEAVLQSLGMTDVHTEGQLVTARLDGQQPEECCRALVEAGVGVRSLTTQKPTLEDTFVALTGEGFDVVR